MKTVMNVTRNLLTINLDGQEEGLYLPKRAKAILTAEQFASLDVKALVRGGYLRVVGGEG